MKKDPLLNAISNLDYWLDSWKDKHDGIHGFVVHHHLDALEFIAPDSWTQSSAILGHLKIFEITGEKKFLKKAVKESEYLAKNYDWKNHVFKNSNFEQKSPKAKIQASLIHNAYPSTALLKTALALKNGKTAKRFYKTGKDCCENYIIAKCWNESKKAFTRGIEEKNPEFVLNMASNAVTALIALDEFEKTSKRLEKYCTPCVFEILKLQKNDGAFPYSERSRLEISIYQALTMQGLLEYYEKSYDEKVKAVLVKAKFWLEKMLDPETSLFYHRIEKGKLFKYPEFFAGSLIIAQQLKRVEEITGGLKFSEFIAREIIKSQYSTGALPNFHGFSDVFMPLFYPAHPRVKKWRDVIPIPGWNALAFYSLAHFVPENSRIPKSRIKFPETYKSKEFAIIDGRKEVVFKNKRGKTIAKWVKNKDFCEFCNVSLRSGKEREKHALEVLKRKSFPERTARKFLSLFLRH